MMTQDVVLEDKLDEAGKRRIVVVIFYMAFIWLLVFVGAGTLKWLAAWVFVGLQTAVFLTVGLYVVRKNPAIVNERGRKSDKTEPWDKLFSWIYVPQMILLPLVSGLDYRFGWSEPVLAAQLIAALLLIPAFSIPYWAMLVNDFLTVTVRLQEERGHFVVTAGPYQFVRHPMYTGAIVGFLMMPVLLGTWWGLVPAGIMTAAMMWRTAREDQMLQTKLPGYTEYAQQVRFRLLPGVW